MRKHTIRLIFWHRFCILLLFNFACLINVILAVVVVVVVAVAVIIVISIRFRHHRCWRRWQIHVANSLHLTFMSEMFDDWTTTPNRCGNRTQLNTIRIPFSAKTQFPAQRYKMQVVSTYSRFTNSKQIISIWWHILFCCGNKMVKFHFGLIRNNLPYIAQIR